MKRIAVAALLLAALAILVWYARPDRAHDGGPGAASAAAAPASPAAGTAQALGSAIRRAGTTPPRITRLTPEERQHTATRIEAARSAHAATTPPRLPEGSAEDDTMATAQAVLEQLQQVTDQIRDDVVACSKLAPEVKAFKTQITLSGDPDIGTLIDAPTAGSADDGSPLPRAFDECVRSHMQLLELPPMPTNAQFSADFAITL